VKPEHVKEFIEATRANHFESVKEPGNLRFDILQQTGDPTRFTLYEAYESEEAAMAHKETKHYLSWRETVAGWMASPREGIKHLVIEPTEKKNW
jgi:autoinducer 2-degrading protein